MKIEVKQLSLNCNKEEYEMLQNIQNNENGFSNPVYEKQYEEELFRRCIFVENSIGEKVATLTI